jgi:Phage major capsid protein E
MPALDIFSSSAFSMVALTDAINKMPFVPGRIGQLGLFREQGVSTTSVMIEEREGNLNRCVRHRLEQCLQRVEHLLGLARRHRLFRAQVLFDQRRQLSRPALGRPRDVEPLRQLHLRHEHEHHDRAQILAAAPRPLGSAPEASQLPGLPAERCSQSVHHKQ